MAEAMSEERLAEIRRRVTGPCSCCGYDKHDFDQPYALELLEELDRLSAAQPQLTDEYGLRIRHISTLTEERAIADTLDGALEVLAAFDAKGRADVVSRELLAAGVEEWRKVAEADRG